LDGLAIKDFYTHVVNSEGVDAAGFFFGWFWRSPKLARAAYIG
jgi:hypothetical protein